VLFLYRKEMKNMAVQITAIICGTIIALAIIGQFGKDED